MNEAQGAIHSTQIPTGPTGKSGPPQKVDPIFETFPVGPNRSIEFWTEISGNFGWMDRAHGFELLNLFEVFVALNCDVTGIWWTRFHFENSNA